MENKLFEKISNLDKNKLTAKKENSQSNSHNTGRKVNDEVLQFEVRETDPELVAFIKNIINTNNITKTQLYDKVGPNIGYNMIYSLTKVDKPAISWERIKIWLDIMGKEAEIIIRDK